MFTCSCIYAPSEKELMLMKRAVWITMGKSGTPKELPAESFVHDILEARHSPIRTLNFAFLFEGIPSNVATHLARHVHAVPFVESLRNDRQEKMDGDAARRDTPVRMIYYVNAEELMTIANKRLCNKASKKTREAVGMMCLCAEMEFPALRGLLIPFCEFNGGVCHEMYPCGKAKKGVYK